MPTTAPSIDRLRDIFADASDVELRQLHAEGAESYTTDAWHALDEEFVRRGFATDGAPPIEESPPTLLTRLARQLASEAASIERPTLSEQGQKGERQLRIISTILFIDAAFTSAVLVAHHRPYALFSAIGLLSFMYFLTSSMHEGRSWARWLVIARNIVVAVQSARLLFAPAGGADVALAGLACVVYIGITLPLAFARPIRVAMAEAREFRERSRPRVGTISDQPMATGDLAGS